ncbi:MAG: efflux system, outer rane lipoprotein NodT family [Bryobacterales bacterium]|jgi:NodT family efflux transporter outer membrane factor (OMF) lipoprotein|nr:efflux system, outer rane lipoprotein NodT family [Bryobacterales bacterium]
MNPKVVLTVLGLATLLASCTVGPKYSKATVPAAPSFSEQPPEGNGWTAGKPSDAQMRGNWWEIYGDADLNALEQQVAAANQTLKISEANFVQARAQIQYNRSNLYPTVSVGPAINSNRISGNNPSGFPGRQYAIFDTPISVSYDVDLWGRIRRSIAAAREQYQASAADMENVRLELQTELAVDYFEARGLDAQKVILDDNVTAYQKALQLTRNRFAGGVASKAEVAQAQTQLDQTEAQDIDIGVARAQYVHAIAVLTGRNPEQFEMAREPLTQQPPAVPTGVPSQLLERRPDIAAAERQMASANEQIGIARSAFFPDLVISATGGLQSGSIVNWFTWPSRFWAVGPQMVETIFDAGRRRSQVTSAQAGYDSTVARYRQTALTAFQEIEDNLAALRILEQEQAKQHEATEAALESVALTTNRYKGGLVTFLDVVQAQTIALNNEQAENLILRRRMGASVQLIRALGGGWDTGKLPQS